MRIKPTKRIIVAIWLGWAIIMLLYFALVPARFKVERPDRALFWTAAATAEGGAQDNKHYLQDPFLQAHVAWDSEYYLAIALDGYEAPYIERVGTFVGSTGGPRYWPFVIPGGADGVVSDGFSLSYAFFPFYPLLIRTLSVPLSLLGLTALGTAALAGVIVSLLGALAASLAMFELGKDELGESGGLRAVYYLLIFPSAFFMSVVYTEGLFLGLAFSSLLLTRRGHLGWAALLAVLATYTRAVGVALFIPLLIAWVRDGGWLALDLEWRQIYFSGLPWKAIGRALLVFAPLIAFVLWRVSYYGMAFSRVEEEFFGRGLLSLGATYGSWRAAFENLFGTNQQATTYYLIEFGAIVLAFWACIRGLKRYPDLAWFGLLVVVLSFTSGPAQGMHRYILAAPPVFLMLSEFGRKPLFDRLWTLASVLLLSMMATLFIFDMWAG
ncbi:MAG: hypothetical protein M9965_18705 [Anaerolineae bacterium]|nr:hypothetical protein [Anaerolineae bacterium]MCO5193786.1 hypothetical protein [Anaerolineae bacterium]